MRTGYDSLLPSLAGHFKTNGSQPSPVLPNRGTMEIDGSFGDRDLKDSMFCH